jgi:hypothetical protein
VSALAETSVLRSVVAPVGAAFLLLSAMTVFAARLPAPRPSSPRVVRSVRELRPILRSFLITSAGGYVAFLAIILLFSVGIVGDVGALRSAAWSGAFLVVASGSVFAALAAVPRRAGRR